MYFFAIFVCCFVLFCMLQIVKMYMTIVTGRKKKCSKGNSVGDYLSIESQRVSNILLLSLVVMHLAICFFKITLLYIYTTKLVTKRG